MPSIFTKIIEGEIPCYKIAEDEHFLAFLDINPNAKGHTLCIPKKEVDKIWNLDDETYTGLLKFSKKVAHALEEVVPCMRVAVAVIGIEVPHTHVHLIPLNDMKEMSFQHKVKMSPEEFSLLAKKVSEAVK
ncbi:HIT family protein [Ascidiimonas sp. W6]|uniref:HIT family protein n=1 Tax=Ascidiimonas meishanensis TaxID=3128903 RepID=UPI0030EE559E